MRPTEPGFLVKICGVTSAEDAAVAIEAGANAIGFNFYPKSPRYVTPETACSIAESVPGGYRKVGVFVNAGIDELSRIAERAGLDTVQLHGDRSATPPRYRVWRSIAGESGVPDHDERVEAYVLDTDTADFGGSGRTFAWSCAAGFPYPAIVAGGLDASNVSDAIAQTAPWGVDACSRLESRPGKKDPQRVREFVRAALDASRRFLLDRVSTV